METSHMPAGLLDSNFEFFEKDGDLFYLTQGQVHHFMQLDLRFVAILREDLEDHPRALKAIEKIGITDPIAQVKQWAICNFGDFDHKADLTSDGVIIREHVHCSKRGSCPFEGIICQPVLVENGTISEREIQVIKLVARDLLDKQIADFMGISAKTVAAHIQHIEQKIGCHSKAGITSYAFQNNLI